MGADPGFGWGTFPFFIAKNTIYLGETLPTTSCLLPAHGDFKPHSALRDQGLLVLRLETDQARP